MRCRLSRAKRIMNIIFMRRHREGYPCTEFLKKAGIFGAFGEKCYWYPRKLPAEPKKVLLHNSVNVATDVYFCDHDVIQYMLNNVPEYLNLLPDGKEYPYKTYEIEIFDNVFIGAHSIIIGNVKFDSNAIIAAGYLAKVISDMETYVRKRGEFV